MPLRLQAPPSTSHRDPEDEGFQQKIVAASQLDSPTLYSQMEAGRKRAAETLAQTPSPRKRKAITAAGATEILDLRPRPPSTKSHVLCHCLHVHVKLYTYTTSTLSTSTLKYTPT